MNTIKTNKQISDSITIQRKTMQNIDLVYLWCDGEDPSFITKKKERFISFGKHLSEENNGSKRYVQHDELRFSLRSAYKNIPWINHIFIVTDHQKPHWIKDHPKISIIDHSQIIPEELLPTFSSPTIEMYLSEIPNLAEHFIYSNDDMFFFRSLHPEDFFSSNGNPIVWLYPEKKLSHEKARQISSDLSRDDWEKTLINAWLIYNSKRQNKLPFYTPAHSVDSYTKSIFNSILSDYPELRQANSLPFRTGDMISRLLFSYEMIGSYGCELIIRNKTNFISRILSRFIPREQVAVSRENLFKLKRDLRIFNPKTFCLNNLSSDNAEEAVLFLKKLWPEPAPWEK